MTGGSRIVLATGSTSGIGVLDRETRVNAIAPGLVDKLLAEEQAAICEHWIAASSSRQSARPTDVADAVIMLTKLRYLP
ncbi:MAG: hypothetical protein ACYDHP_10490 [Ferrimicrobium sp.]